MLIGKGGVTPVVLGQVAKFSGREP